MVEGDGEELDDSARDALKVWLPMLLDQLGQHVEERFGDRVDLKVVAEQTNIPFQTLKAANHVKNQGSHPVKLGSPSDEALVEAADTLSTALVCLALIEARSPQALEAKKAGRQAHKGPTSVEELLSRKRAYERVQAVKAEAGRAQEQRLEQARKDAEAEAEQARRSKLKELEERAEARARARAAAARAEKNAALLVEAARVDAEERAKAKEAKAEAERARIASEERKAAKRKAEANTEAARRAAEERVKAKDAATEARRNKERERENEAENEAEKEAERSRQQRERDLARDREKQQEDEARRLQAVARERDRARDQQVQDRARREAQIRRDVRRANRKLKPSEANAFFAVCVSGCSMLLAPWGLPGVMAGVFGAGLGWMILRGDDLEGRAEVTAKWAIALGMIAIGLGGLVLLGSLEAALRTRLHGR